MPTRILAAGSLAALAIAVLTCCSPQAYWEIDNRSGQEVTIEKSGEAPSPISPGQVAGKLTMGASLTLRAGACTYAYTGLAIAGATPRKDQPFLGAPTYSYHTRLEPDFTLRLFNVSDDGRVGPEVSQPGWPAHPQVECRSGG